MYFKHPQSVCMSYIQHMRLSLYFSAMMWWGSIQAFIHAFIPDLCITSTSNISKHLYEKLKSSGCDRT